MAILFGSDEIIAPDYVAELAATGWNRETGDERAYCKWQLKYLESQWNYSSTQPILSADRARAMRTLAQFQRTINGGNQ